MKCGARRHCCNAQSSQWPVCSYTFAVKFLCACSHQLCEVAQVVTCICCQACCMQVEGLYKMEGQGPGPPGTALLHAVSWMWQGSLTSGQGPNIFLQFSNEDGRGSQELLPGNSADVCRCHLTHREDKGRTWVSHMLLPNPNLGGSFSFPPLPIILDLFLSGTATSNLKNVSDTPSLKPYVQFVPLWFAWKGGGCWQI